MDVLIGLLIYLTIMGVALGFVNKYAAPKNKKEWQGAAALWPFVVVFGPFYFVVIGLSKLTQKLLP